MDGFLLLRDETRCENCGAFADKWCDEDGCVCSCPRCGQECISKEGREGFDLIPGDSEMAKVYVKDREAVRKKREAIEKAIKC